MQDSIAIIAKLLRNLFAHQLALAGENLALRQQLAVLQLPVPRPKFRCHDRVFWVVFSRLWAGWCSALVLVHPTTVVARHRRGFRLFCRWKSGRPGRPKIPTDIRCLIRRLSYENPLWGVPRIQAELALLGHNVADSTVAKYRVRTRKPPSPTWRTFLNNQVTSLASIDFIVVPTVTFRLLYGVVVLRHDRRLVRTGISLSKLRYTSSSCLA